MTHVMSISAALQFPNSLPTLHPCRLHPHPLVSILSSSQVRCHRRTSGATVAPPSPPTETDFGRSFSMWDAFAYSGLYLQTVTDTKLVVDTSRGEKLKINFDITFPSVSCTLLSLDAIDISGEQHLDIKHSVMKNRIDSDGHVIQVKFDKIGKPNIGKPKQKHGGDVQDNETYCGSCFGAEMSESECCNTCDEVRDAYRRGWGLMNPDLIDQVRELEEKQDEMIERQSQMEEQIAQQAVREAQMMEKQSQIEAQLTEFMKQFRPPDAP